jgi:hypothetical protein
VRRYKSCKYKDLNCGCSSVVERHVANVNVEGSSPFARFLRLYAEIGCAFIRARRLALIAHGFFLNARQKLTLVNAIYLGFCHFSLHFDGGARFCRAVVP